MSVPACTICDTSPTGFRWTDAHGIAACLTCGAPYRVIHYEGERRLQTAPELLLADWYVPFARRYWSEEHRNVYPGAYNLPGSSYEVATQVDVDIHNGWMERHRSEWESARAAVAAAVAG